MSAVFTGQRPLPRCPISLEHRLTKQRTTRFPPSTLAIVRYGESVRLTIEDPRLFPVRLLSADQDLASEYWFSERSVTTGVSEGLRYAEDGLMLYGWIAISETHLNDLEEATRRSYSSILRLLNKLNFPHWLRAWNFLSAITDGSGDRERYRRFTVGRHRAFAHAPGFEQLLPAATVIGTRRGSGLRIGFLASRVPGIQVENPRQTSAFRYPRLYGPQPPSFSRAILQRWRDRSLLYVSGTASIVGHATQHAGDPVAQLGEACRNIDALLEYAAREHAVGHLKPLGLKLYVRNAEVYQAINDRWIELMRSREWTSARSEPTLVLIGDLCRRDLLVEIEGVFATAVARRAWGGHALPPVPAFGGIHS